jgi:hypothetical protein
MRQNMDQGVSVEVYQQPTYLPRFPATVQVSTVPFEARSIPAFFSRRPDFFIISSAGLATITMQYAIDWKSADNEAGEGKLSVSVGAGYNLFEYEANRAFLDAIEQDCLGYTMVAEFENRPWIAQAIIPTLAPTLRIFQRSATTTQGTSASLTDSCQTLLQKELGRRGVHNASDDWQPAQTDSFSLATTER